MIRVKKYLPVSSQIFYAPLIKENLRLEFSSFEYKLNDLSLLTALMLRDGKNVNDIAAVTLLPRDVIENIIEVLKSQGMLDEHNERKLPEQTQRILELSDCINAFNVTPPPIFSDLLTKSLIILPQTVKPEKSFDDTICAACVKNCEQIWTAEFEDLSNFVKDFLVKHGARNFVDELKVLRLNHSAEILYAARELRFLPVVGEGNSFGVNWDSARTIKAELPVRKFKSTHGKEFNVDLLLGTIFEADDTEDDSEEITLSFKPNLQLQSDKLRKKISAQVGEVIDEGFQFIKISIAEEVAGDFLCV